jgi:Tol biopolymer transport system component
VSDLNIIWNRTLGERVLKRTIATALGALLSLPLVAEAQYFGRNKVQYDRLHFEVLETTHFDIHYDHDERDAALIAGRLAERWYDHLSLRLGHTFTGRQPIVIYGSHAKFSQTTILPGLVPEGVGGFTDHLAGRVVLPFAAGLRETEHVLGHEIVHAFQRDILRRQKRSLSSVPLWFSEGMAEYLSIGGLDPHTRMWLRDAVASGTVPALKDLDKPRWFPYRSGQALWAYLVERAGDDVMVRALEPIRGRGSGLARIERAARTDAATLTSGWQEYVKRAAGELPAAGQPGLPLAGVASRVRVGAVLSPDGQQVVVTSDAGGYTLDVLLLDVASGRVLRKLMRTSTDPHADTLEFIDSAGAWSPDGRRFALTTRRDGRPVMTVFAMPGGEVTQRLTLDGLDEVYTPTWSPDASEIAFTGLNAGFSDVYSVQTSTGAVHRWTHDPFSDLQPAWSPDGRQIAFATDRFTSSLDDLTFGDYRLGVIDIDSGTIRFLGGAPHGKSINPQWTSGGSAVLLISDADGVNNVYRLDVPTGTVSRLTDAVTGVSGITASSPALSVDADGERLAIGVYEHGRNGVRVLSTAELSAAATRQGATATVQTTSATHASADLVERRPYRPRLSLFNLGQPYLSAGGGPTGTFVQAGVGFSLSDLLAQQEISVGIQGGKHRSDFAFDTTYLNHRSRVNWGVSASSIPWLVGMSTRVSSGIDGTTVRDVREDRQLHRQFTGLVSYPLNVSDRLEASVGVDLVRFSSDISSSIFSGPSQSLTEVQRGGSETAAPANSMVSGVAFVRDTAVWGIASPAVGERYRLGLASSVGSIPMMTATADVRRYALLTRNLTLATRLQMARRFGAGATDTRVLPLVWSMRDLVRGAEHSSVSVRALGSAAFGAELRAPLAALLGRSPGALPVELFTFSDAARLATDNFWSAGIGARVNAGGFPFEFNLVQPLRDPAGWHLTVLFRPGF